MASVNKVSLREEFTTLKDQFECLCAEDKVSAEIRALVQTLLMLFELLMAMFMEKHTPKNSRNATNSPRGHSRPRSPARSNTALASAPMR